MLPQSLAYGIYGEKDVKGGDGKLLVEENKVYRIGENIVSYRSELVIIDSEPRHTST